MKLFIFISIVLLAAGQGQGTPVDPIAAKEVEELTPILKETQKLKAMFQRYKRVSDSFMSFFKENKEEAFLYVVFQRY